MIFQRGVVLLFFFLSTFAWAFEVPTSIERFLIDVKNRPDLVHKFKNIKTVTPQEFLFVFNSYSQKAIAAGFNGIVFKDDSNHVTKLNFSIYAAQDLVTLDKSQKKITEESLALAKISWAELFKNPVIANADIVSLRKAEGDVGSQPVGEELLGTLLWSSYNPRNTDFPDLTSDDGLAFRTRFIEGIPLKEILESQRSGTDLHKNYNFKRLWKEVVFWQKVNEIMLQESGVMVDILTPGNFIVTGNPADPKIELIDNALIHPSPEAHEYYLSRGITIPTPSFTDALKIIIWPTVSEHIVISLLWNLNYDQALDYIQSYYDLDSRNEAIARLSKVRPWVIVEAPRLGAYGNIERAKKSIEDDIRNCVSKLKTLL